MRKLAWFAASCSAAVFLAVYVLPEGALVPLGAVCALAALAGLALRGDRRRQVPGGGGEDHGGHCQPD